MKNLGEILTWLVAIVIFSLIAAVIFFNYVAHKECEARGGVMLRKVAGAVCVKVESL